MSVTYPDPEQRTGSTARIHRTVVPGDYGCHENVKTKTNGETNVSNKKLNRYSLKGR